MKVIHPILLLLLLSVLPGYLWASPEKVLPSHITVIHSNIKTVADSADSVELLRRRGIQLERFNLDAVDALEARWSNGLPATENAAKQAFEQRLALVGKKAFSAELIKAYRGLTTAIRYKIDRYPAIIFDDQFIVYGVTDLEQALRIYSDFVSQSGDHHE